MVSRRCVKKGCKAMTIYPDQVCGFHGEPGRSLPTREVQGELFKNESAEPEEEE